ncbi:hypothetical protein D3C75_1283620 [compost metagenome]
MMISALQGNQQCNCHPLPLLTVQMQLCPAAHLQPQPGQYIGQADFLVPVLVGMRKSGSNCRQPCLRNPLAVILDGKN